MTSTLTICTAAAGSGKTFSLVKEYLKIILKDPRKYRFILAITFTNKATAEMKERVLLELENLSLPEKCDMKTAILKEMGQAITVELIERNAKTALQYILHDYSQLSIMTIDSFFQLLIRSFARELKIPIGSGMDLDINYVLTKSIDWLFEDIGQQPKLTEWLLDYMNANIETGKGWKLEKGIMEIGKEVLGEKIGDKAEQFTLETIKKLTEDVKNEIGSFEQKIKSLCKSVLKILEHNNIEKSELKSGIYSFYEKADTKINECLDNTKNATIRKWASGEGNTITKENEKNQDLVARLNSAIEQGFLSITKEIFLLTENEIEQYNSFKAIEKNIYNLGIIHFLAEKIKQYRSEENTLLISDSRQLLNGLIGAEDAPFIFEKVGAQYQHILLDEFQDTSNNQWDILHPLVINILGQGGKVFIVGDAKQAIYKWRGGNVQLIVKQIFDDLGYFLPKTVPLKVNYRSRNEIIEFNNLLFSKLQKNVLLESAYIGCAQEKLNENSDKKGYVEINFLTEMDLGKHKFIDVSLSKSCDLIENLLKEQFEQKDIAVLVRKKDEALKLAQLLNQKGIKVISDNSLVFANYEPIKLIIHTLHFITEPTNNLHYTHVLFLYAKLKKLVYEDEILLKNHLFLKNHSDKNKLILFQLFPSLIPEGRDKWVQKNIYELVESLIHIFELNPNTDPFLLQFLDIVLGFFQKKNGSAIEFLNWWDFFSENLTLVISEETNAVRILTIHQAKGLEFPVVILPSADWDVTPKPNSILWFENKIPSIENLDILPVVFTKRLAISLFNDQYEQEIKDTFLENINLLYVATTRAVERLYVFSGANKTIGLGQILSKALTEIATETTELILLDNKFILGEKQLPIKKKDKHTAYFNIHAHERKDLKRKQLNQSFTTKEINIGELLHEVLSKANNQQEAVAILAQMKFLGKINEEQLQQIKEKLQLIWALKDYKKWVQHYDILSERDFVLKGKLFRPDKVFYNSEETIIVDYKTGIKKSSHQKQVLDYVEALRFMGFPSPKGCLLYISEKPILEMIA